MDWKAKQAEAFASAEGFDPAALPGAVQEAGFTSPDTETSLVVTVAGTVVTDGGTVYLSFPGTRWKLAGDLVAGLVDAKEATGVRLKGAFQVPKDDEEGVPTLLVLSVLDSLPG